MSFLDVRAVVLLQQVSTLLQKKATDCVLWKQLYKRSFRPSHADISRLQSFLNIEQKSWFQLFKFHNWHQLGTAYLEVSIVEGRFVLPIIQLLGRNGIGMEEIACLSRAGYQTVNRIVFQTTKRDLTQLPLKPEIVDTIIAEAAGLVSVGWMGKSKRVIPTNITELDVLLGGGLQCGALTEIMGAESVGKKLLCHHLCVTCQFSSTGELSKKVLYIDTKGSFDPKLILQIAHNYGVGDAVLDNIITTRVYKSGYLITTLDAAFKVITQDPTYCLIIMDDLQILGPRDAYEFPQGIFYKATGRLYHIKQSCDIAVVYCNQVQEHSIGKMLGEFLLDRLADVRLWLQKGYHTNTAVCKVYKSNHLRPAQSVLQYNNINNNNSNSNNSNSNNSNNNNDRIVYDF